MMVGDRQSRRPMPKTPAPAGFDEIQSEELSRLFGRVIHLRLAVVPVMIGLLVWLAVHPMASWRRNLLGAIAILAIALFVHEVVRHRRHGLGKRAFAVNFAAAALGQAVAALATGGLGSPLFIIMYPIAMVGAVVVEPLVFLLVAAVQLAAIWGMAWLHTSGSLPHFDPAAFGGDAAAGWNHAHVFWFALVASMGIGVARFFGRGMRRAFDHMLRRGLEAREEALRTHTERARELAALSAEIAHELKNPLASIKGLAALLAQDAGPGKPAERMEVLRREVVRMQAILDEFLNFSRPLVPLAVESVDLPTLVFGVADMHEGMAHERGVRLVVRTDAATLRCDPRKIEQALINIVQNAIDASPADATVEIESEDGAQLQVRVLDRGPGVDGALGDKVFEPGVTTKAHGSGLGLTIARALVRQHGGELTLTPRQGGGSVAALCLPREARA